MAEAARVRLSNTIDGGANGNRHGSENLPARTPDSHFFLNVQSHYHRVLVRNRDLNVLVLQTQFLSAMNFRGPHIPRRKGDAFRLIPGSIVNDYQQASAGAGDQPRS